MAGDRVFSAHINPLAWLEADEPWSKLPGAQPPSAENLLSFLCTPGEGADLDSVVRRYREIATEPVRLFVAPADERILQKLVWPLRHAKASYAVGNWLGTISLGGMVAEMVAVLLWDTSEVSVNGRPMTEKDQEAILGRTFEKLDQVRRVDVLASYGVIDSKAKQHFDNIRAIRRKYLHLWSHDHSELRHDAVKLYQAALSLVVSTIITDVKDGKLVLNPHVERYLERAGAFEPMDESRADVGRAPRPDDP